MDLVGRYRIAAPRDVVWHALNDPSVLKECIPGCEELVMHSPTNMSAKVVVKIGPVKARFAGTVTLEEVQPPSSYTITGEGQGGVAGFAKGGADVTLTAIADETELSYQAHAKIGGKLAQLGSRLVKSTSDKLANQFFAAFKDQVEGNTEN